MLNKKHLCNNLIQDSTKQKLPEGAHRIRKSLPSDKKCSMINSWKFRYSNLRG